MLEFRGGPPPLASAAVAACGLLLADARLAAAPFAFGAARPGEAAKPVAPLATDIHSLALGVHVHAGCPAGPQTTQRPILDAKACFRFCLVGDRKWLASGGPHPTA